MEHHGKMIGTSWKNDRNREKLWKFGIQLEEVCRLWHPKNETKPRAEGFGLESRGVGQGRERDVGNCPGPEMTAVNMLDLGDIGIAPSYGNTKHLLVYIWI